MPWAVIITAILKTLGPLLLKRLEDWLNRQLEVKAAGLSVTGDGEADAARLLRVVRDDLWAWQWRRKAFLSQAILDVPPVVAGRAVLTEAKQRNLSRLGLDAN